jgi:hypothetical protein
MEGSTIADLTDRVLLLERENRRWRQCGAGVAGAVLLLVLAGGSFIDNPRVIDAAGFVVRDANGKAKASLALDSLGMPELRFFDQNGRLRLWSGVALDGSPSLTLLDDVGKSAIGLVVKSDQSPGLVALDKDGKVRAELSISKGVLPALSFKDPEGNIRISLGQDSKDSAVLNINDPQGRPRCTLEVDKNGWSEIQLRDEHRKQVSMALDAAGPDLEFYNLAGQRRLELYLVNGMPNLKLLEGTDTARVWMKVLDGPDGRWSDISIHDANGQPRLTTTVRSNGTPSLNMFRKDGTLEVQMGEVLGNPIPRLIFNDQKEKPVLVIPFAEQ